MKTTSIHSRLDENNLQKLKEISKNKGLSLSTLIRIILIEYIEKIGDKNGKN